MDIWERTHARYVESLREQQGWTELEINHQPHESSGGSIACSCGWPTKAQYDAGEPYIRHVVDEATSHAYQDGLNDGREAS